MQIFRARRMRGGYPVVEPIPAAIDDGKSYIAESFIAPDQSYMLLGIYGRPDGYGNYDIYISYRRGAAWSPPINLGPVINTPAREYSPRVTPDGKYLIYTSERGFATRRPRRPFTYEQFMNGQRGILNGYGNIYRIDMRYVLDSTRPKAWR